MVIDSHQNKNTSSRISSSVPKEDDGIASRLRSDKTGDTWNLSDKIIIDGMDDEYILAEDVKKFIKRLKENCWKKGNNCEHCDKIDKLAGEELSK